jgi:hypothetical protein
MKQLIIVLLILNNFICFSQENKIDYIKFNYNSSVVLYSEVNIAIYPNYEKDSTYTIKVETYKMTKEINISDEKFKEILNVILNINNREIIQNFGTGLDGSTTTIEIGNGGPFLSDNYIKYEIWALYKTDSKTPFKTFLEAVKLILKESHIKIDDFN